MRTIPVDSTDARELRELEADHAAADLDARRRHEATCRGGWLGEDDRGRPVPCQVCRRHLLHQPCTTCSAPEGACAAQRNRRRGPCCRHCEHPTLGATP